MKGPCQAGRHPLITSDVPGIWSTPCAEPATIYVGSQCGGSCGDPACKTMLELCAAHAHRLALADAAMRAEKARLN